MKGKIGILLVFICVLSGCVNVEKSAMLYEIRYPQGTVAYSSMYAENTCNTYHLESDELDGKEKKSVSVYLNANQEKDSASYKAVGEDGDFVLEFQYADGNVECYEYASDLHSKSGSQIVLRREYLEETESLLVYVEEWNSHFFTAYIDGYLEQTETYRIDLNSGEILWKNKNGQNEFVFKVDCTKDGDGIYFYKEGAVYCLTGERFEQVEKLAEVAIKDTENQEVLVFDLTEKTVRIYYKDTPETYEFVKEQER